MCIGEPLENSEALCLWNPRKVGETRPDVLQEFLLQCQELHHQIHSEIRCPTRMCYVSFPLHPGHQLGNEEYDQPTADIHQSQMDPWLSLSLEDLIFADDIVLPSHTRDQARRKTT